MTAERWPRFMIRATACEYVSLSAAGFEREIIAGNLPSSVMLGGKPHWCRSQLDTYLDRLAGSGEGDWRAALPIYQRLGRGA